MRFLIFWSFIVGHCLVFACGKKGSPGSDGIIKPPVEEPKPVPPASVDKCEKCIILSEQAQNRVVIVDTKSKSTIWEWRPALSNVKSEHVNWFVNMSDAKVVYGGKYVLACASRGGVALIRIADKKTVFYAYSGTGNTHSIEMLPDGNIVSASSTGNYMTVFKVDTLNFPDNVYSKDFPLESGHNVVWDLKNNLLWATAQTKLKTFRYNFDCKKPELVNENTYDLEGTGSHDLFPVYGENALWLTMATAIYKFNIADKKLNKANDIIVQADIKSISSGPSGFQTILLRPKEEWWSDEIIDSRGNTVFYEKGLRVYKARWVLDNAFSYPENAPIKQCK